VYKIDLNHLTDLDALLSEGSVAGAAKRLNVSAPAMSRRLAHLRHALGDPLFVQAGRGLVPTERALALRDRVQTAVEDVRRILQPQSVDFATVARTLTLRANDGFFITWAARLATRLAAEAPRVRLRFTPRADKNVDALRSGAVDLDIGVMDYPGPEIKSHVLLRAPFVGVVRAGHPILQAGPIDVTQFVRWPHVSASRSGQSNGPIDTALKARGLERRIAVVVPGFQAALALVLSSDFIAAIPELFIKREAASGNLHSFPLPIATPPVDVAMSWHPRNHADPLHCWLRDHVRATVVGL
jgi:DNA-binding transcriptional LysR family regulator